MGSNSTDAVSRWDTWRTENTSGYLDVAPGVAGISLKTSLRLSRGLTKANTARNAGYLIHKSAETEIRQRELIGFMLK